MADSFFKKENNKKKTLIKKQKAQKREDRKTNNNKGKGIESMIIYVDNNGHFTSVPPEKREVENEKGSNTEKTSQRIAHFSQKQIGK
ncbi:hypothetical protein [Flavobacterium psychrotrophum]|uniref:hypothetical protein n=1 Tax=Flavobacterium psychrotrophum TaxID=2294119 RepID=UPI001968FD37|nr:hypothetical protein [Flavobacterium psychrotrophum]